MHHYKGSSSFSSIGLLSSYSNHLASADIYLSYYIPNRTHQNGNDFYAINKTDFKILCQCIAGNKHPGKYQTASIWQWKCHWTMVALHKKKKTEEREISSSKIILNIFSFSNIHPLTLIQIAEGKDSKKYSLLLFLSLLRFNRSRGVKFIVVKKRHHRYSPV